MTHVTTHLGYTHCLYRSDPGRRVGQTSCPHCSGSPLWLPPALPPMVPLCMCRVSVLNVPNKHRHTAVPLYRHCKFSTCRAHQIYHAGEETANVKQAASLTFPGSCWADKVFTVLQFYAYTLNPPYPVQVMFIMLNALHTCSKSLTHIGQLRSTP